MVTLKLNTPIQFGSETIQELTFQDLKAKHIRHLPKEVGMNEILGIASTLSGLPDKFIDELTCDDTLRVVEVINGFFLNSQGTTLTQ